MGKVLSCFKNLTGLSEENGDENTGPDVVKFALCRGHLRQCARCAAERNRESFENRQLRRWDNCEPVHELGNNDHFWIPTPPPPPRVAGFQFTPSYYKK
ncbi:unnamed protein product [Orchesella dallaii]|uniref:Uncharacterized protein n=1 Tax=Orchesella dallaii TaxID=48710 RepID=A0ABP1S7S1_9HEXA